MATWRMVCDVMEDLPGAELGVLHGGPVWRVRDKIVVKLGASLRVPDEEERRKGRGELLMLLVDRDERAALLAEDPDTFFETPHYVGTSFLLVWLKQVKKDRLRELLVDGWRLRASKAQIKELEGRAS